MSGPVVPFASQGAGLGSQTLASATGAQALDAAAALARREAPPVREVAQEFEALLLGELTRQASTPLPGTNPLDGGSAARLYREQFFQHVARLSASQGGVGLAEALERQLGGLPLEASAPEADPAAADDAGSGPGDERLAEEGR